MYQQVYFEDIVILKSKIHLNEVGLSLARHSHIYDTQPRRRLDHVLFIVEKGQITQFSFPSTYLFLYNLLKYLGSYKYNYKMNYNEYCWDCL